MFDVFHKYYFISLIFIIICFIGLVFLLNSVDGSSFFENNTSSLDFIFSNDSSFIWPTPKYKTITSPYGYRVAPTNGAGKFHAGIDIGAAAGTEVLAAFSGEVTYIGFYGANGYTIRISDGLYTANYSHVSPYFLVYLGQNITKGDMIATVGPKHVYDVPNNPYKDSNRKSNKWRYYRSSSSFFTVFQWQICKSIKLFRVLKKEAVASFFTYHLLRLHYGDDNHVNNNRNHHLHSRLPSLVQSYFYIQGILFLLFLLVRSFLQ